MTENTKNQKPKIYIRKAISVLILVAFFLQPNTYNLKPLNAQEILPPTETPTITPTPTSFPETESTTPPIVVENQNVEPSPTPATPLSLDAAPDPVSAAFRPPKILRSLLKKNFKVGEKVIFSVANADVNDFTTKIEYIDGTTVDIDPIEIKSGNDTQIQIDPPRSFKPGKYKVLVTIGGQIYEQDFTWGVLAINTNKSMYLRGEIAKLAMAVLDEKGEMVCSAKVDLEITYPTGTKTNLSTENGEIKVNPNCHEKKLTLIPDYEADFQLDNSIGTYNINLTAETFNGTYSIDDSFQVKESVDFDVERITATRLYPPLTYPVTFKIKANRDYKGKIVELVPDSFGITQLSGVTQYSEVKVTDDETLQKESVLGASTIGYPFEGEQPLTQGFGTPERDMLMRKLYFQFGVAGHDGMDFGVPEGTAVLSVDDGTVALADHGGTYGSTIVVEHSWGRTYYGHLSKFEVKTGDLVKKGEKIALSGSTGLSTGPHLHFGIKLNSHNFENGYYGKVNPAPFLGINASSDVLGTSTVNPTFQTITWDVNVKAGETITLGYQFKAPPISPQLYRLGTLRFYESGNPEPVFQEARQWMLANDAPNNQFVKTGTFAKRTSTGSQSVTGLGFKPKAIIFYWTDQTAAGHSSNGSNVAGNFGVGFATGPSNERAMSQWDEGQTNPTTNDSGRATYNNASIVFQGNLGVLTLGIADLTSFDPDGFTVNWSVADSNAYIVHYYALSETIISNAIAETFTLTTGTPNYTISATNAGFQPDFVLMMSAGGTTHGSNIQEQTLTMGAASSATSRWSIGARSDDGVDVSDGCSAKSHSSVIYLIGTTVACGTTTEDAIADFTQFTSNGFDLTVTNSPAADMDVFYLALKGNNTSFKAGNFRASDGVDPSPSETGVGFQPSGIVFANTSGGESNDSPNSTFFFGSSSGPIQNSSINQLTFDLIDAETPDTRTSLTTSLQYFQDNAGTLEMDAAIRSFDPDGFTFNYLTGGGGASIDFVYWAIGEIQEPVDLMRHGAWFHNGVEQPFAF